MYDIYEEAEVKWAMAMSSEDMDALVAAEEQKEQELMERAMHDAVK